MRSLVGLFALCAALLLGCAKQEPTPAPDAVVSTEAPPAASGKEILLISNNNSPFWDSVTKGVEDGSKEFGVPARLERNDGTDIGQIRLLEQALANKANTLGVGVSVLRPDAEGILTAMRNLADAGVPVITFDSDCLETHRLAFVGTDNRDAGKQLGAKAAELMPEGAKVCVFVGDPAAQNANDRLEGFKEGAGEKFEILEVYKDDGDPARAQSNVESALIKRPDCNLLLGLWSYNGPAIVKAVQTAGAADKATIICFDAEPQTLTAIEAGQIAATLVQRPYEMGRMSVQFLKAAAEGDQATLTALKVEGTTHVDTGVVIVTPDSIGEFKNYLIEKGLEGS